LRAGALATIPCTARTTAVFLPPYSPELNPIERLWLHLRDNRLSHCVFQTTGGDRRHLL
jgi:transposase